MRFDDVVDELKLGLKEMEMLPYMVVVSTGMPMCSYRRQANETCRPSSRAIMAFACTNPGMSPL